MLIYHCVSCLNYELRHSWEVSSIVESYGENLPDIFLDVAVCKGHRSDLRYPESLAEQKNSRVKLRYFPTDRETFAYRGRVRTEQLLRAREAKADWIFFADCDRAYHPRFFSELARKLKKIKRCQKIVAQAMRKSSSRQQTNQLIEAGREEGPHHPSAFFRVQQIPIDWARRYGFASGGMQVVNLNLFDKLGWYYAKETKRRRDHNMFTEGQRAHSDVYFRWRVGGSEMLVLPDSIHMEHNRDKEAGCHLEEQR